MQASIHFSFTQDKFEGHSSLDLHSDLGCGSNALEHCMNGEPIYPRGQEQTIVKSIMLLKR